MLSRRQIPAPARHASPCSQSNSYVLMLSNNWIVGVRRTACQQRDNSCCRESRDQDAAPDAASEPQLGFGMESSVGDVHVGGIIERHLTFPNRPTCVPIDIESVAVITALIGNPAEVRPSGCQALQGVPLEMSRIHPECADSDPRDRLVADVLLRQEPDEEEDEEEDDGDRKEHEDDENEEEDDG